ncbi:MAG: methyltransferase domain-containing protein [Deltaproteobacteria bacterium]|nr:methyltransferase domain-containing protein [Deltaproteobacteria bacterium]
MKSPALIAARIKKLLSGCEPASEPDLVAAAGSYWQLSGRDDRIQDQSHWCGAMRWQRDRWFAHGDVYFSYALRLLNEFAGAAFVDSLDRKTAMEWGCGGGANMRCLCQSFSQVYGVDIAPDSLDACKRQLTKLGFANFSPLYFPVEAPEAVLQQATAGSLDFLLSIAVFQHFPSKVYTLRVLQVMEKLLMSGGFALIQVRYSDGSEKYRQKNSDYAKNVITMTSFTFDEFAGQVQQAGLTLLHSEKDIEQDDLHHEYYFIRK